MARLLRAGRIDPPQQRYPMDSWSDGRAREIKRGEDFQVEVRTMRSYLYWYAMKIRKRVSVRLIDQTTLQFQFHDRDSAHETNTTRNEGAHGDQGRTNQVRAGTEGIY